MLPVRKAPEVFKKSLLSMISFSIPTRLASSLMCLEGRRALPLFTSLIARCPMAGAVGAVWRLFNPLKETRICNHQPVPVDSYLSNEIAVSGLIPVAIGGDARIALEIRRDG